MSTNSNEEILARLASIEQKLDYVVERQRWTEELVSEMTPIARLVMTSASNRLADWEKRGAFEMLSALGDAADGVLDNYTPEDARELAGSLVAILGTVRNLTQLDILEVANDATDVLHHTDEVQPVGMFGAMRKASKDDDVQRGMGVALEVLRQLGRVRSAPSGAPRLPPPARLPKAAVAPGAPAQACAVPVPPPVDEVVHWEGHDFDSKGFLLDPNTWNRDLATKIAAGLGIQLTDAHFAVIDWVRADYAATGASPNVRRVALGSGAGTEAMYQLFPPTPGKTCAMIAGVPKPVGCV
ncbi:MAG: TusE/DsrC/DsvC family sulfur relay protein [Sandaracinaceae bacterium]|nr:TusE/DsrC/DsvC family sulfur relay protein [Sandaracinaceae bacterium]